MRPYMNAKKCSNSSCCTIPEHGNEGIGFPTSLCRYIYICLAVRSYFVSFSGVMAKVGRTNL